ncbi:S-adenosyl-L-methionine-dependent methyltransferase [Eremomyces bilateralis CBS 781.70]|uniref:S-adenosyl-L-methionine-dependent methyltransferase n=1 Tax=Eremomyces bilateralis CBS 781.70 TaxID=1392243 RepID=A0A6G1FXA2_9PEZI|nr:S-adenosyl-L-methionine-dependent methyltransferase [Eremomyces bilateralis CBS 781.70]KAF1810525.1 S-adenosyl-L-methionine-dependent methyltransferase [Eremomyces bilateralis CBS 781.70]
MTEAVSKSPSPAAPADRPTATIEEAADVVAVEVGTEVDSAIGDDGASETTSLASSILEHTFENGRRYHSYKSGKYIMPDDDDELDRLDIHHHIALLHLNGELHLAPIGENPGAILDVGTGTGIWAIDMGDKYPSAKVTGVDLSPRQPSWVPPNVQFEIDDVEDEWNFRGQFDFVHCRYLAGSIHDWSKLIKQCFRQLNPGGWVEFKDWDVRPYSPSGELGKLPDNAVKAWHDVVMETCGDYYGATPTPALIIPDICKSTGFTKLENHVFEVPSGSWPKDKKKSLVGQYYGTTMREGAAAMSMRLLTAFRGWDPKEVDVLNAKFREDMKTTYFYHKYHIIYAQKPLDTPET